MEENSDGKRKTSPSIPTNYITILHLQERWINQKDRKRKEEEEKRRKQQVEEQPRIEDDLKKTEKAIEQRDEEKRLDRSNRKNCGRNSRNKEPMNGGDVKVVEKEEPEVTAEIGSERGEDTAVPEKELRGFRRKRYNRKKKQNIDVAVVEDVVIDRGCGSIAPPREVFVTTDKITPVKDVIGFYRKKGEVAVVEDVVVDCGCGSIAPPPEVVVTEKFTPVKDASRAYWKKGKKTKGKKSVTEVTTTTAIETQFEDLSIKKLETKNLKEQTKLINSNRLNQGNDLVHQRVRMPIRASGSTMVWVKKEQV